MVYTGVMRGLHYMHVEWYAHENSHAELHIDPSIVTLQLVCSFSKFMRIKMRLSTDEVLCLLINCFVLTNICMMFEETTTVGDYLMVESIYNEYFPVLVHLDKSTYYNIIFAQIYEYYGRMTFYVLQWIR